ncbi:alpha/beta hydrolase [Bacillus sp. CGMCC 1.60114]|uniref:alpha/beta hydrolase n=1 Tax=unclassified Bacillus (in: firmicutes) TaxID=185979 RepID=UPI00363A925A
MFFSKIIDQFALYDLHKKRSNECQFSSFPKANLDGEDVQTFYKTGPVDIQFSIEGSNEQNYKIVKFLYNSNVKSGYSCNDIIPGEAFLAGNEDATNVILVHGWRMDSSKRVKNIFHNQMIGLGWNMYYFTLPYHFERKPECSLYSGEYMISANIERTVQSTQQAVADLRGLIQWIKKNKKGPVVLIGVSLGGFITNLTALVESEIDVLVSVFYANRLSYSIWKTNPGKYIKADLQDNGVTYKDLVEYWKIIDPSQAIPMMNKDNILLISAKHDQYVHIEDTSHLWESWGRPRRYVYNCGHSGIVLNRKKIAQYAIDFIRIRIMG